MGAAAGGASAAEEEGDVDETGVEAKDIELVMSQVCMYVQCVRAFVLLGWVGWCMWGAWGAGCAGGWELRVGVPPGVGFAFSIYRYVAWTDRDSSLTPFHPQSPQNTQAGCSRAKAVSALKRNDGDIVNAIMELTV